MIFIIQYIIFVILGGRFDILSTQRVTLHYNWNISNYKCLSKQTAFQLFCFGHKYVFYIYRPEIKNIAQILNYGFIMFHVPKPYTKTSTKTKDTTQGL